ncbi:hypothetical protein [Sphingobacterium lumbrici]|uniref:hypothetical protein n=1 Tax=Sphingobacterium lumbrici TaxID=2559600 RepID=UPI00112DCF2C|nr:hypothetical protein [Sphingobacterium lumbrici]
MSDKKEVVEPKWEEFYNYRYWREEQRRQLTIVSNVYFALGSAMIGFTIKYLIDSINGLSIGCDERVFLVISICFSILSLIYYVLLTDNKLKDYRETARMIADNSSIKDIQNNTKEFGEKTWKLFMLQKVFLIIGFLFCALGYLILIFSR